KVGKAEGCLGCRLKELNGIQSPRLTELRRRGASISTPRPWCGANDWVLWASRKVDTSTVYAQEDETSEGRGIFEPIEANHLPKPNGEIFVCVIFDELAEYLDDVMQAHGGGFGFEPVDEAADKAAFEKTFDALGEYLARALDMETDL